MVNRSKFRNIVVMSFLLSVPVLMLAQTENNGAELKKLGSVIAAAKARVALNERKLAVADSLITLGDQLIDESKKETKGLEAERRKLDKDKVASQKLLTRLASSKVKEESGKARADLKALDVQYRSDVKTLNTRLKDSSKKMTAGNTNLTKGKAARGRALDALKASKAALRNAQAEYEAAYFSGGNTNPNNNIIK